METAHFAPSRKGSLGKQVPPEIASISQRSAWEAIQLSEACSIRELEISEAGLVSANLKTKAFGSTLRIQVTPAGRLFADPSLDVKYSLVLAFYVARELANRKTFPSAPVWLNEHFQWNIAIRGEAEKLIPNFMATQLRELQAYWALLDLAAQRRSPLPPADLARYVLNRFPDEKWKVQRAAMEAILERLSSVKNEGLKPAKGSTNRVYRIYRAKPKNILPYKVTLGGNELSGSCTCKDFQKNLLGICKHTAAVLLKKPKWGRFDQPDVSRLVWTPPTKFGAVRNLKHEIFLESKAPLKGPLASLFDQRQVPAPLRPIAENSSPAKELKLWAKLEMVCEQAGVRADSALSTQLSEERRRLAWQIECEQRWDKLRSVPSRLHVKLFPYQREGVRRALRAGRFLLADEMGLGKTVQGIAWAESLLQSGAAQKVLVICPNALKFQWQREWLKTSGRVIQAVEGAPETRQSLYNSNWDVLVLNYELLLRDLPQIQTLKPQAVILDEAQRIKNHTTKTSQSIKTLDPKFRLILTGTPMENRIQELVSLMDWIDSRAMPPLWSLDARMSLQGDGDGHGPKGVTGFDKLRIGLSEHFLRRRRVEVLTQLPKRTDSPLYLPVTEEQKEIHDDFAKKVARLAAITQVRPLTQSEHIQLMRLLNMMRMISNGLAQFEYDSTWPTLENETHPEKRLPSLFSPKLIELRNLIDGFLGQNVKVVLFSQWQRMLHLAHWSVHDLLFRAGVESVFFTGRETARRRTENLIRFHDDPKVRFFFATDAGGVGLNLQHAASVCINLELPWNPAVLEQRNSRIYRLGQKEPVQIFNLITRDTIEERIQNLVAKKQAVFTTLFDGTSDEVRFDSNSGFYKQIQSAVADFNDESPETDEELDLDATVDAYEGMDGAEPTVDSDISKSVHLQSGPDPDPQAAVEATATLPESQNTEPTAPPTDSLSADRLKEVFAGLKFERSPGGGLKIEAEGHSAAVLASVFKGMADLFGALGN